MTWKKCANLCYKNHIKLENICRPWEKFQNLINVGPLRGCRAWKKNLELINIGPMFIPDYKVHGSVCPH